MTSAQLFLFAKPPRIGLSKTRLAKGMGRAAARRIAHFTLSRTMQAAAQSGAALTIYAAPDAALRESLGGIWPHHIPRASQGAGDLSDRLNRAFEAAHNGPVLFIGGDAPDVSPALLRAATAQLQGHDAVFGPARDGGFWLFGMNKTARSRSPFRQVRWSGPHAMEDVWSHLPGHANVAVLPMLIDIDEADDWRDWCAQMAAGHHV